MKRSMSKDCISILGYNIYSLNKRNCLNEIFKRDKVHIVSGNPEVLYRGLHDELLLNNFTSDDALIIPDGVGTQIAARILKTPVSEKIAGIELMKDIITRCEEIGEGIYLIGAEEDVLQTCVKNLKKEYPNLVITGYKNGFFDLDNCSELIKDIKNKKPKAIFVAMGCPRQEKFIIKYFNELPASIFMGVGGSFDVIADKVQRAPRWMINLGLEWAYRVGKEPWRIKRLGSIPKFLIKVAFTRGKKNEK